jgi:type II secretory pathway component PulJ
MHVIATSSSTAHFAVIVAILVGIVGMLSSVLKGAWTFFSSVNIQLEAIRVNSEAIARMNTRMDRVEAALEERK